MSAYRTTHQPPAAHGTIARAEVATSAADEVEGYLERYEAAFTLDCEVDLVKFVPPRDHELYAEVVTELIRVDLELRWSNGRAPSLEEYRRTYPEVFADEQSRGAIAFEEFRLRCQSGEGVSSSEYADQFQIATDHWPALSSSKLVSPRGPRNSSFSTRGALFSSQGPDEVDFPNVGQKFAGFELVAELGRGAFARVYLARQIDLACRFVALKVSVGENLEAHRLAQLQHTNIVPIFSVHRQGALQAVAMPFFGATTLSSVLRTVRQQGSIPLSANALLSTLAGKLASTLTTPTDGVLDPITESVNSSHVGGIQGQVETRLPVSPTHANSPRDAIERLTYVDGAVWIVARIAEGLAHAHARGVLHRDLKPANILLTDDGQPLILDFNLAAELTESPGRQASIGGTLPYMSPEHLDSLVANAGWRGIVDARADIYSLGIILFELLTSELPFPLHAGTLHHIAPLMAIERRGVAPSARARNRSVPPSVNSIVRKAIDGDVTQRYSTAADFAEDLNCHLANLPLRHAADHAPIERAKKWVRRHPRITSLSSIATIVVVLLGVVAIAWRVRQQHYSKVAAISQYDEFSTQLKLLRPPLSAFDLDAQTLHQTISDAEELLSEYSVVDNPEWNRAEAYAALDADRQHELKRSIGEMSLLLARAFERQAAVDSSAHTFAQENSHRYKSLGESLFAEADLRADQPYVAALEAAHAARYERAAELLALARVEDPQDVGVWFSLGNVFAALGRYHEAEGCFTTAAALEQTSPWPLFYRGTTRISQREFSKAEQDFSAVLALRPDWAIAFANRGLARISLNNPKAAIADLDRALELGCSQTRIYAIRAKARSALGDKIGATQDLELLLKLEPSDEKSWVARALARLPQDPRAALTDLKQAAVAFPGSRTIQQDLAHILAEHLHDTNAALNVLNEIVALAPTDVDALTGRAVLLARLGKRDAAVADARNAFRLAPSAETAYKLACVFALVGQQQSSDAEIAVQFLAQAIRREARYLDIAKDDTDLKSLHDRGDYRQLLHAGNVIRQAAQTAIPR